MFISNTPKFIYIAIPKTGTRSIYSALAKNFPALPGSDAGHGHDVPAEYADYPRFCAVRNPYDRWCSTWWWACKKAVIRPPYQEISIKYSIPLTFEGFLQIIAKEYVRPLGMSVMARFF